MRLLRGKVAVVTGAASGIGRAMSQRFAAEGMAVVMADIEPGALAGAAGQLRATGADVLDVVTDVSDAAQVDALAGASIDRFGGVHVICNNAGVSSGGPAWEISLAEWEWVLGVNLWGVIHGLRSFLPRLLEAGEGHVVNTASMAGLSPLAIAPPYSVSKFGVVALSECLYAQLRAAGSEIGVSVLCPGWVRTAIGSSERNRPASVPGQPETEQARRLRAGVQRVLDAGAGPEEVAERVVSAIRNDQLYVLPQDSDAWLAPLRDRFEDILGRRNPSARPAPGMDVIMASLREQ